MLDLHSGEHGYTEMAVPILVRREIMEGSGNLPRFADNLYHDEEDDLWLIPTAEVPVTNLHRDEILSADELPLYYVAHTPCFRREKAAAGRDTRGIKRVHQFNKVEMYKFVEPETSFGELGNPARQRRNRLPASQPALPDPSAVRWRHIFPFGQVLRHRGVGRRVRGVAGSLVLFQLHRFPGSPANVRYRPAAGERPRFVHTLNGSGLALPRVIIAILENNQQPDGSVVIPEALRSYTGFDTIPAA